jgi:hypothetical protein
MSSLITDTPKPVKMKNSNTLLLFWRKAHTWVGLTAGLFLIIIALTGIYLNHKDTFGGVLGIKKPEKEIAEKEAKADSSHKPKPGKTVSELATLPVAFSDALALARPVLADSPIERIELKSDKGRWLYKVKATTGQEAVIDAVSAEVQIKGEIKAQESLATNQHKPEYLSEVPKSKAMDWGKAIKDLHTGKIAGDAGKLLVDIVAGFIILLTLSGLYLWVVPTLRKRRSSQLRAAVASDKV